MNKNKIIKPWIINLKAFSMVIILLFFTVTIGSQNILQKKFPADKIETISIDGSQIFTISVSTSKTKYISIKSTLDGEYQQKFQIITKQEGNQLGLKLEQFEFTTIADDKRNAHKVIAATLFLEIPEGLSLHIISNVGSVSLLGNYNTLTIDLSQGHFDIIGSVNAATVNTTDGYINVVTKNADTKAVSKHGIVTIDSFSAKTAYWTLNSINGNITVAKQE